MCKSMNALFLSFHGQRTRKQLLDKLSRSSNKKEGGYLMYSKIVVIPIIDGYYIRNNK